MYKDRRTTGREIAAELGIGASTVKRVLDREEVERRSFKDYDHDKSHLTKDCDDEIVRLYDEDQFSSIQVAKKLIYQRQLPSESSTEGA